MDRPEGRDEWKARLRASVPIVLPSLLACDFGHLAREIETVEAAGAQALHLDVMDGHFVPNLSLGVPIVAAVRRATSLPLDVHLMIEQPEQFVEPFRDAGADGITIHIEAAPHPEPVLERIRSLGAWAGLALNPPTPLSAIESALAYCDLVLVMSVMPGFGGQEFDAGVLPKLRALRARHDVEAFLEVDGGISEKTLPLCAQAGADFFVAGTAIFRSRDYAVALHRLQSLAAEHGEA
jgi:ribulose-phosphate 3-epimerase